MGVEVQSYPTYTLVTIEEEKRSDREFVHNPSVICVCPLSDRCRHVKTGQTVDKSILFEFKWSSIISYFIKYVIQLACTSQDPFPGKDSTSTMSNTNVQVSDEVDTNPFRDPVTIHRIADRIIVGRTITKQHKFIR